MSHRTPSNAKRRKAKLLKKVDYVEALVLQNPSDEEIRTQILSGPAPDDSGVEIVWAVGIEHSKTTFMAVAGHISCGFKITHQEISESGQWDCPNKALPIDDVMAVMSSYTDGTEDWLKLVDWERVEQ